MNKAAIPMLLAAFVVLPSSAMADLIISEYVEGSSFNKAIELFNTGSANVDLSQVELKVYFNGNTSSSASISGMSGNLVPGDAFVIAHNSWDTGLGGNIDLLSGSLNFNGDDAVELLFANNAVDVIGQIGFDPGSEWGSGDVSTQNNTLTRKFTIITGDTNGSDAFDASIEWTGGVQNSHTLGSHGGTFAAIPEPTAFLFGSLVTGLVGVTVARRRVRRA